MWQIPNSHISAKSGSSIKEAPCLFVAPCLSLGRVSLAAASARVSPVGRVSLGVLALFFFCLESAVSTATCSFSMFVAAVSAIKAAFGIDLSGRIRMNPATFAAKEAVVQPTIDLLRAEHGVKVIYQLVRVICDKDEYGYEVHIEEPIALFSSRDHAMAAAKDSYWGYDNKPTPLVDEVPDDMPAYAQVYVIRAVDLF